jgi:hypothetical protein
MDQSVMEEVATESWAWKFSNTIISLIVGPLSHIYIYPVNIAWIS